MTRRADDAHKFVTRAIRPLEGQEVTVATFSAIAVVGVHVLAVAADSITDVAASLADVASAIREGKS